jgi:hypothetical protein
MQPMQPGRLSPSQIHTHGSQLQGKGCPPGPLRPWHQRRAIRRLLNDGATLALLLQALEAMGEPAQLRVIAEEARARGSRHAPTPLLNLLKSADRFPLLPPDHRVALAMACGEPELPTEAGAQVVPPLLQAWERQGPKCPAETALLALRSSAAVDALCRRGRHTFGWSPGHREGPGAPALGGGLRGGGPHGTAAGGAAKPPSGSLQRRRLGHGGASGGPNGDAENIWQWALRCPPLHSRTQLRALPAGAAPPPQLGESGRVLQALAKELPDPGDLNSLRVDHCTHVLEGHKGEVQDIAWSPYEVILDG